MYYELQLTSFQSQFLHYCSIAHPEHNNYSSWSTTDVHVTMRELTATKNINMKQQDEKKTIVQDNKRAVFCVHTDLVI